MATTSSKSPQSFADGVNQAMQDMASAMAAPDADIHFASEMVKVMGTYLQSKHQSSQQPTAPGGQGGAAPAPGAGGPPGTPPGMSTPGGPAGGSPTNAAMPSMQPPSGPSDPGSGPTPGLSPNPDELRRTLQGVSGQ